MNSNDIINLLEDITVLCRDNGVTFESEKSERVQVLKKKLVSSDYLCTEGDLFLLYHKRELKEYSEVLLVSTHIDCKRPDRSNYGEGITRCFSAQVSKQFLKGTYDNAITNTAILCLMLENRLPEDVIIAFTGDEEENCNGALAVVKHLRKNKISFASIVLDVTDAGWQENVDFTIENNFWHDKLGKKVISLANTFSDNWFFVPEEVYDVPEYVAKDKVYYLSSESDESWDYDEADVKCFSLCIPVNGNMHSDEGVYVRIKSFMEYILILETLANGIIETIKR